MRTVPSLLFPLLLSACLWQIPDTDAEMVAHFHKHKAIFEKMVSAESDCVLAVKEGPICKDWMQKTNVLGAYKTGRDGAAIALDYNEFNTHNKGYVYSDSLPGPMYSSLDSRPTDLEAYSKGYRRIEGNWYIYYEFLN